MVLYALKKSYVSLDPCGIAESHFGSQADERSARFVLLEAR